MLNQSETAEVTILADVKTFKKFMDWMDRPATVAEVLGMKRLLKTMSICVCDAEVDSNNT